MELNVIDQIKRFQEFIEVNYYNSLLDKARKGEKFLLIDFAELSKFDPDLATELLDAPEETIKAIEKSVEQFDIDGLANFKVRFHNLPNTQNIMIRDIRSEHINKLYCIQGLIRQKSDVRPQVTSARFECPMCGNIMNVLQLEGTLKEPSRCGCGRKGKFIMLDKDLVDAQGIVLEEASENLEGGEQPKRFNVLLTNDLVSPISEKRMAPGSKVGVIGIVKEVPIISKSGGKSTRFDLMMESNYIKPMQDNFHDINITEEEEKQILEIANDPKGYDKLVNSIAPSIYGYEKIKEALLLQLMGGVRKVRSDMVVSRGDFHILLVGDPGCIAGDSKVSLVYKGMEQIKNLGKGHLQPIKEIVTKIRKRSKDKFYDFATLFHHYRNQPVLRAVTETGKELICTYNQPLLTKNGWQRADELLLGTEIRVMPKIPNKVKNLVPTNFTKVPKKSGLLKKISLPDKFTPELASLCGYIIGDGHVHKKGYNITCYVNNEEKDIVENISGFWKSTFNVSPSVLVKEADGSVRTIDDGTGLLRQIISKQTIYLLETNSRQIAQSLSFLSNKRVPQQIFRSPNHVVAKFISWLFEADGCSFGNGRGRTSIQLKSATHELLLDVQLLLLYFGIQSRVIEDNLCIRRSRDMELFARYVGFNSEKKKKSLNLVLEVIKNKSGIQKRKRPQRYEKVVKILPAGIRDVYDFEVPVSQMFIANGIVCHNSGKSALLKRITTFAPKGRYVSGKGVSLHYDEPLLIKENNEIRIVRIGEFVDSHSNVEDVFVPIKKEIKALSLNLSNKKLEWKDISHAFRHRLNEKLLKFELESGRGVTITKDHSVYTLENGKLTVKKSKDLTTSDYVLIPKKMPVEEKNLIDEDYAKFLGYFIAEGHLHSKQGEYYKIEFTFGKKDSEIIDDLKRITKEKFNKDLKIRNHGENGLRAVINGKNSYEKIVELLGSTAHKRAKEKKVPEVILNSAKKIKRAFIDAYLKGDAGVTKSKELASCLAYLFLQDSIIASFTKTYCDRKTYIKGREINNVGWVYELKSPKAGKKFDNRYSRPPFIKFGKTLSKYFFKRMKTGKYSRVTINSISNNMLLQRFNYIAQNSLSRGKNLKELFGNSILEYLGEHRSLFQKYKSGHQILVSTTYEGEQLLNELIDFYSVLNSDLGFVRIKRIEEVENNYKYVYDISIPENENFVAGFGGIICHNSGAGLTAAVVRDEFLRGWALEAGAMVLSSDGLVCVDELDKMSNEDRAAMHEALENQSYHPDTEIMLSDGSAFKIGDFVDELIKKNRDKLSLGKDCEILNVNDIELLTTDFEKIFPIKAKMVSRHKAPGYFIKITYSNGRSIKVTPEHPVFVFLNEKIREIPAENVKAGLLAPAPRKLPTKSKNVEIATSELNHFNNKHIHFPSQLNHNFARLLGYVTTEGHAYFSPKNRYAEVGVSNTDESIVQDVHSLFENTFDTYVNTNIQSAGARLKATKDLATIRLCSVPFYNYMNSNFKGSVNGARNKYIDNILRNADRELQLEFLRAAFKGDGFVDSTRFGYSTSSFELAKGYQDLLLQNSISSRIDIEKRGSTEYYKVSVTGTESFGLFIQKIAESDDSRLQKLGNFYKSSKNKRNERDILPSEILIGINSLLKSFGLSDGYFLNSIRRGFNVHKGVVHDYLEKIENKLQGCVGIINCGDVRKIRRILNIEVSMLAKCLGVSNGTIYNIEKEKNSERYFEVLAKAKEIGKEKISKAKAKSTEMLKLINAEIKFLYVKKVERIENEDVEWVYDVTVEPTRTFISEGLVLHNTVSISKANIQATLIARTTVLAAANPKFGRFDPYGIISDQIDLPPTLINRFDLIFPIKDLPEEARDERMAKHILTLHQSPDINEPDIPTDMLRKYIAYARQKISPQLTDGALEEIKNFYLTMRKSGSSEGGMKAIPISARQLEALVRLSEASARSRLDGKVTRKDSKKAIELLDYCLMQVGFDRETGKIDIDRIATGISASQRSHILVLKDIITELESKLGKTIPIEDVVAEAKNRGLDENKVEEALERLKRSGDVYEPRRGFVSRL